MSSKKKHPPRQGTLLQGKYFTAFTNVHDFVFDKMINLKLNPDRVDVIVPAGKIYQFVLNKMNVEKITVPKIGLADGMVHELIKKL